MRFGSSNSPSDLFIEKFKDNKYQEKRESSLEIKQLEIGLIK